MTFALRSRVKRSGLVLVMALFTLVLAACGAAETKNTSSYTANIGLADSAALVINVPYQEARISTQDTNIISLIETTLESYGNIDFRVYDTVEDVEDSSPIRDTIESLGGVDEEAKVVTLDETDVPDPLPEGAETAIWDIRINPEIPTKLDLTVWNSLRSDMRGLNVESLRVSQMDGMSNIVLPTTEGFELPYVGVYAGDVTLFTHPNQMLEVEVLMDSGSLTVNVPPDVPLRVNVVDASTESAINLPEGYVNAAGDDLEGEWSHPRFADAESFLVLNITNIDAATLTINQEQPGEEAEVTEEVTSDQATEEAPADDADTAAPEVTNQATVTDLTTGEADTQATEEAPADGSGDDSDAAAPEVTNQATVTDLTGQSTEESPAETPEAEATATPEGDGG